MTQDNQIKALDGTIHKGFSMQDGPFVKSLDDALTSFNVQRQSYYSDTFVGNHVHTTLKVTKSVTLFPEH